MKRILLIVVAFLAFIATPAFASLDSSSVNGAGWNKLSDAQKTAILSEVAYQAQKKTDVTPAKVSQWLDVGTKIGVMMGGAAKQLGVQVNEFIKTPVGKWTMAIIIWNYMGGVIVHMFGGLLILFFGTTVLFIIMRRSQTTDITYSKDKNTWWGAPKKEKVDRTKLSDDQQTGYLLCAAVVFAVSLFAMFSY